MPGRFTEKTHSLHKTETKPKINKVGLLLPDPELSVARKEPVKEPISQNLNEPNVQHYGNENIEHLLLSDQMGKKDTLIVVKDKHGNPLPEPDKIDKLMLGASFFALLIFIALNVYLLYFLAAYLSIAIAWPFWLGYGMAYLLTWLPVLRYKDHWEPIAFYIAGSILGFVWLIIAAALILIEWGLVGLLTVIAAVIIIGLLLELIWLLVNYLRRVLAGEN